MSHHFRSFAITMLIVIFLIGSAVSAADDFSQRRLQRWHLQAVSLPVEAEDQGAYLPIVTSNKVVTPQFSDTKINDDNSHATFNQRYSDVAYFPGGKGVAVWEDEGNGKWDIYAQSLNAEGTPVGANRRLIFDANSRSQRQPRLAVNSSGRMMIVWVDEESASLYFTMYDSVLTSISNKIKINDNSGNHLVNAPVVTALTNDQFVVVWEDSRSGANIYCQLLDGTGNFLGNNFPVNTIVSSPIRIAPDVCGVDGGDFAVVWEDSRGGAEHSYFRAFNNNGNPISGELRLEQDYPAAEQVYPQIEFLKGNAYFVAWISNRNNEQSVYGRLISADFSLVDTSFRINSLATDSCMDLRVSQSPDSGVVCVWTNLSTTAAIEFRKINRQGSFVGETKQAQDNGVFLERDSPSLAFGASGAVICWTDQRNLNSDIYIQRFDSSLTKVGSNLKLNDDLVGSQQFSSDICGLPLGSVAVVWHDRAHDQGDISLQRASLSGSLIDVSVRVNDDPGISLQNHPRIGSAADGRIVVVWEDGRGGPGLSGQNIFGQLFVADGERIGDNFWVNNSPISHTASEPDVAVADDGAFVVVWVDQRAGKKQIYLQRYDASGAQLGSNLLVADITGASDSYKPHVGIRADGSCVVSFISIVGLRQVLHFQRFNSLGVAVGSPGLLDVDTTQVKTLDDDIFVHDYKGDFFVSVIQSSAAGSSIRMFLYDINGDLHAGDLIISDVNNAGFADLRINGDIDDAMIVSWSDIRTGARRSYFQLVREDGFHLGSNMQMHNSSTTALEMEPAAVLNHGYYFCTWTDNRNLGYGFDIFLNAEQYTTTAVDDTENNLPQQFQLEQNYPNPFNPQTVISYAIDRQQPVKLVIYNILGRQVKTLVDTRQAAGQYEVVWDGTSAAGEAVASGVYFYRLTAGDQSTTRKMTLLK